MNAAERTRALKAVFTTLSNSDFSNYAQLALKHPFHCQSLLPVKLSTRAEAISAQWIKLLSCRLDVTLYLIGWAPSIKAASSLILSRKVLVNGVLCIHPSFQLTSLNDLITVSSWKFITNNTLTSSHVVPMLFVHDVPSFYQFFDDEFISLVRTALFDWLD